MSERISIGDIEAFGDVLDLIGEQSDEFDLDHAAALHVALKTMEGKVASTRGLLEQQLRKLQDGTAVSKTSDGLKVTTSPVKKKRPDHSKIRARVIRRSLVDENGERLALPEDAVEQAVEIVYALFVSPSDPPKTKGLARIGMTLDEATLEEITGHKTEVVLDDGK